MQYAWLGLKKTLQFEALWLTHKNILLLTMNPRWRCVLIVSVVEVKFNTGIIFPYLSLSANLKGVVIFTIFN